jgi:hypothetical protein
MIDILALQQALPIVVFPPTSRYANLETASIELGGTIVVYVRRRFVPLPGSGTVIAEHTVVQAERLDHIAARYLGDPELFWRIADANRAMRPDALIEAVGRRLLITLPDGVQG